MISACCCGKKGQCCGVEPATEAGVALPSSIAVSYSFVGTDPNSTYCQSTPPNTSALWRFDSCWGSRPRSEGNDCYDYDPAWVRAAPVGDAAGINHYGWVRTGGASDPLFFNVVADVGIVQQGQSGYYCNPSGGAIPCDCSSPSFGFNVCSGSCSASSMNVCNGCTQVFNRAPVAGCKMYICGGCGCDPNSCANYAYLPPTETLCGRIAAADYSYDRWRSAAFVGWCQSQDASISKNPCNDQRSNGCALVEVRAVWNGTDYVAPQTTAYNGSVHTPEVPKAVARIERTAMDAIVDWNTNLVVTHSDCPTPLTANGRSSRQYGETAVAAPLLPAEMNLLNGTCEGECNSGQFGACKEQCAKCQQATVTVHIIERGARMDAIQMQVGQEYEIVQANGFPFHCHGAGNAPAVGQLFVASDCVQLPPPAPQNCACPTAINQRGAGSYVLPVRRHEFSARGRGHIGDLLQEIVDRFQDGRYQYEWDTTDQTQRGYSLAGYTLSIVDSDSWVGGSEIASNCCDEPQYMTPYINDWEYGCVGCIENLYQHWSKAVSTLRTDIWSIPNRYYAVQTHCRWTTRCVPFTATLPAYEHSVGCCPPVQQTVVPAQTISGCILAECEWGGFFSWESTVRSVYVAAKRGRGSGAFGGLWGSVNLSRGVYQTPLGTSGQYVAFSFTT